MRHRHLGSRGVQSRSRVGSISLDSGRDVAVPGPRVQGAEMVWKHLEVSVHPGQTTPVTTRVFRPNRRAPLFSRAQVFDGRTSDSVWNGVHAYSGFGWAGEGLCPQRSPGVKACVKRRELAPRQAPHDAGRREGPRVGVPRGLRNKPEDDLAGGTIPSTPDASPRGEVTKRQRPSAWRARHRTVEQSAVWCRGSRGGYWGASAQQPKWPQCARGRRAVAPMRRRPAAQQSPQEHGEKLSSPSLPCPLLPSKGDAGCPPISLAVVPGAPRACD